MKNARSTITAMSLIMTLFLMSALGGCVINKSEVMMDDPAFAPKYPNIRPPRPATPGSLFADGGYTSLFDDAIARRVGDILTIVLNESTISKKSANTSIKKDTDAAVDEPSVLGVLVQGKGNTGGKITNLGSENQFTGSSSSDQQNSLQGNIAVTISEVLPNGSLIVRGEKWMHLNQGSEFLRISGMVRPVDISSNNQVPSDRLANARISYGGKGVMANSNKPGWLARFFVNPLFPI